MKRAFFIIIFLLVSLLLKSQDFGIWTDLNVKYEVWRFDFKVTNILRTNENVHNISTAYVEPEIFFHVDQYISAGIGYKYLIEPTDKRGLWIYDVIIKAPIKKLSLEFRFRSEFNKDIFISRIRPKAKYKIGSFKPYISSEVFVLNEGDLIPKKWRHIVGVEYKLNDHNFPAIEYIRYENLYGIDLNILSLKYSFLLN